MEKYGVRVQKGDVAHDAASAGAVSEKLKSESERIARATAGAGRAERGNGTAARPFAPGAASPGGELLNPPPTPPPPHRVAASRPMC